MPVFLSTGDGAAVVVFLGGGDGCRDGGGGTLAATYRSSSRNCLRMRSSKSGGVECRPMV